MSQFSEYQRFTFGKCAFCNAMASISVSVDAHMNDCIEFNCPKCGKPNSTIASVRGVEPGIFRRQYRTEAVEGRIRGIDATSDPNL